MTINYSLTTQQAMLIGPIWAQMGSYMGPIWAIPMGVRWDVQHGFIRDPYGQIHMGTIWEPVILLD